MQHHDSLIHGVLKPMPWGTFDQLVDKHGADKHVRTLSTKSQLVAPDSCPVVWRDESARDRDDDGEPRDATLSSGRRRRRSARRWPMPTRCALPASSQTCSRRLLAQAHPGLRRGTKEAVRLIDSTSVSLSNLSNDWASYEAHGAGAKLHVVFDPECRDARAFRHHGAARQRHRGRESDADRKWRDLRVRPRLLRFFLVGQARFERLYASSRA